MRLFQPDFAGWLALKRFIDCVGRNRASGWGSCPLARFMGQLALNSRQKTRKRAQATQFSYSFVSFSLNPSLAAYFPAAYT
jgi:hypothetical protein